MRRELLICSFFILCLIVHSVCAETTFTPKVAQHDRPLNPKQANQLRVKGIYGMITKSSRKGHPTTNGRMHQVYHLRTYQNARAIYGGSSDLNRPRPRKSAASSLLQTPTFSLSTLVRHLAVGTLLVLTLY